MKTKRTSYRMIAWMTPLEGSTLIRVEDVGRYEAVADVEEVALDILDAGNSEIVEIWDENLKLKLKTLYRNPLH